MELNNKQTEAVAKFAIDIVKIIVAVFIIGGLVPKRRLINMVNVVVGFIVLLTLAAALFAFWLHSSRHHKEHHAQ